MNAGSSGEISGTPDALDIWSATLLNGRWCEVRELTSRPDGATSFSA
jgi:hypothetical protein